MLGDAIASKKRSKVFTFVLRIVHPVQWIIGPAEGDTERYFQFVGITASVVSVSKVDFISIRKLSIEEPKITRR